MTFSKYDSIGEMDDDAIQQYLIDIGNPSVAGQVAATGATGQAGKSGVIEIKPVIDNEADDTRAKSPTCLREMTS